MAQPNDTAPADPRPSLFAAVDQAGRVLALVEASNQHGPTPCSEWTVADLSGHCVAVVMRIGKILNGAHPDDLPRMVDVSPDDLDARFALERAELVQAIADDAVLSRIVQHPAGPMPGAAAIGAYINELAVHSWDLNRALGDPVTLDEGLADASLAAAHQFLPADLRGGDIPFDVPSAVDDDAPAPDRLAAWMGRDPSWSVSAS